MSALRGNDTILRNLSLLVSWRNLFVFVLHPLIAAAVFGLSIWTYRQYTRHITSNDKAFLIHFLVGMAYTFFTIVVAIETGSKIKIELQQAGYIQRRTRARELDLALNFAVLGICYYKLSQTMDSPQGAEMSLRLTIPAYTIITWLLICHMALGPVIWFTVRAT